MDDPREVESYDRLSLKHLRIVEKSFVRRALELLAGGRHGSAPRVLDVGAGPGNIPASLAIEAPPASIVAVDLSPGMLEKARERFRENGLAARVQVVCAHSERLPFRDRTFQLVYSHSVLHHLTDPAPTLDEISRVTATGCPFLVRDLRRPPARLLGLYVRVFGARYDSLMKKMYRESLAAGYTFREMRALAARISGASARARRFFITHVGIEGTRLP